eukprot:1088703-Amphidinium_carterae.2
MVPPNVSHGSASMQHCASDPATTLTCSSTITNQSTLTRGSQMWRVTRVWSRFKHLCTHKDELVALGNGCRRFATFRGHCRQGASLDCASNCSGSWPCSWCAPWHPSRCRLSAKCN